MSQEIAKRIEEAIRTVPDFPKPGIMFKDITPILLDSELSKDIAKAMADQIRDLKPTAIAGVESRGFLFGLPIAMELGIPFVLIRKKGKLPAETVSYAYDLEYGSAEIEMHKDAIGAGDRVVVHDDLLATGGTAAATAELITKVGAEVAAFSFLVDLTFLNGVDKLKSYSGNIYNLVRY